MKYFLILLVLIGFIIPYAFGSEKIPSSQDYPFEKLTGATCDGKSTLCYGTFLNGTIIPVQCDYIMHGCGVAPFDNNVLYQSPLKQFKSGISMYEIQCKENLYLAYKSGNDAPVCVKLETGKKLLERGFANCMETKTELSRVNLCGLHSSVDGNSESNSNDSVKENSNLAYPSGYLLHPSITVELNETQYVGQKIEFTINFNGTKYGCYSYPSLIIENSEHQNMWEGNTIVELCDPDYIPSHFEKTWNIGNSPLGVPIINQTGYYTLFSEFENEITQKDFWVK